MSAITKAKVLNVQFSSDSQQDVGPTFQPLHQSAKVPLTHSQSQKQKSESIRLSSHRFNTFKMTKNILMDDDRGDYEIEQSQVRGKVISKNPSVMEQKQDQKNKQNGNQIPKFELGCDMLNSIEINKFENLTVNPKNLGRRKKSEKISESSKKSQEEPNPEKPVPSLEKAQETQQDIPEGEKISSIHEKVKKVKKSLVFEIQSEASMTDNEDNGQKRKQQSNKPEKNENQIMNPSNVLQIDSNKDEEQSAVGRKLAKNLINVQFEDDQSSSEGQKITQHNEPEDEEESESQQSDSSPRKTVSKVLTSTDIVQMGSNLKDFTRRGLFQQEKVEAVFTRDKEGMNYFSPQFDLFFRKDYKHIISAKKQVGPKFQMYFSIDRMNVTQKLDTTFCGKLVEDVNRDVYNIYAFTKERRYALVCSALFRDDFNSDLPKVYDVFILKPNVAYSTLQGVDLHGDLIPLNELYFYQCNRDKMYHFQNRKPEYKREIDTYVLNFSGRISRASVKNFILEDPETHQQVMMFGRGVGQSFNLQFIQPLSPFLAFGLALPYFSNQK